MRKNGYMRKRNEDERDRNYKINEGKEKILEITEISSSPSLCLTLRNSFFLSRSPYPRCLTLSLSSFLLLFPLFASIILLYPLPFHSSPPSLLPTLLLTPCYTLPFPPPHFSVYIPLLYPLTSPHPLLPSLLHPHTYTPLPPFSFPFPLPFPYPLLA